MEMTKEVFLHKAKNLASSIHAAYEEIGKDEIVNHKNSMIDNIKLLVTQYAAVSVKGLINTKTKKTENINIAYIDTMRLSKAFIAMINGVDDVSFIPTKIEADYKDSVDSYSISKNDIAELSRLIVLLFNIRSRLALMLYKYEGTLLNSVTDKDTLLSVIICICDAVKAEVTEEFTFNTIK